MLQGLMGAVANQNVAEAPVLAMSFDQIVSIMINSLGVGLVLAAVTYLGTKSIYGRGKGSASLDAFALLLGSANLLFLCVGLTGVTLLINNNIVRAFAIVAALALIRFRVKLDQKSMSASVLFGVMAGMACGLQEMMLAWVLTGFYVILLGALIVFLIIFKIQPTEMSAASLELDDEECAPTASPTKS
jgi:hypothetical protein